MEDKFVSKEKYYDYKDVLIQPKSSTLNSRNDVNLFKNYKFRNGVEWNGIPIIAANMTTTGTLDVYKCLSKHHIITALHKFHTLEDLLNYNKENPHWVLNPNHFMISTGIGDADYKNLTNIVDNFECKFILIDVANGYIDSFKEFCKKVKTRYPTKIIVAGNVCTYDGVGDLIDCGVDIIKCGIGGGSACTTRIKTGIGMPQLSCVLECKKRIKQYNLEESIPENKPNIYIIGDGGITCPGDMAKGFGAGADFIMVGGEFAGHDENPGEIIEEDGVKYKFFYGMSSDYAMKNNYASTNNTKYRTSEGREIKLKYKGKLDDTVRNYLGGVRSACTYTNSDTLWKLEKNTEFILVNNQYNTNLVNGK